MTAKNPEERSLNRVVSTWLTEYDYIKIGAVAAANGVTVASYLRGIIVDAIAEEMPAVVEKITKALNA